MLNWHKAEITLIFWKWHWYRTENSLFRDHSADIFLHCIFFLEENKLSVAEEFIFSCCCFFHWSHHNPPFVTSEFLAGEIIMISQTEDYDLQMRKAQRGGPIPKQQPSDICEIFAKMSLQLKKKNNMRERGQEGNIQKILSAEWFASQLFFSSFFFFQEFSIWCLWFSNLSHLALMNTRHFFSVPYVLWSLRKTKCIQIMSPLCSGSTQS